MVDKDLARTKLASIAANVAILAGKQVDEQEFLDSVDQQYVVLHALQLAIQAALDLAAHLIADEGWDVPERSGEAFLILSQKKILDTELGRCEKPLVFVWNIVFTPAVRNCSTTAPAAVPSYIRIGSILGKAFWGLVADACAAAEAGCPSDAIPVEAIPVTADTRMNSLLDGLLGFLLIRLPFGFRMSETFD